MTRVSPRRLWALCRKEALQIVRDPSSVLIAFILPVAMIFLFGYGVNLDTGRTRIGIVVEDAGAEGWRLADQIAGSPYLEPVVVGRRTDAQRALKRGEIRGFVVVPQDFSRRVAGQKGAAPLQIVTDGSEPNTAAFVSTYVQGAIDAWSQQRLNTARATGSGGIDSRPRLWFNAAAVSRQSLVPGSIVIVMTVVGALLTSLVVAREWERGTMEALLASPVTRAELLLSKLLPYFGLGLGSMALCVAVATLIMGVPLRGSLLLMLLATTAFLGAALGLGLLLSTVLRSQFNAAQAALNAAFLPALMLSGFIYEIASMPLPIRWLASLLPARYFVTILQTLFQSDAAGRLYWSNLAPLAVIAVVFLALVTVKSARTLD